MGKTRKKEHLMSKVSEIFRVSKVKWKGAVNSSSLPWMSLTLKKVYLVLQFYKK